MGSLRCLPDPPVLIGLLWRFLSLGTILPISPGLPLPTLSPPQPLRLTPPPGTQKVSPPAAFSCWGEGAGSAKDRFGGQGLRNYRIRFLEGGEC